MLSRIRSWNKIRLKRHRAARAASKVDKRETLCVMTIVKNEALNITEWADHYSWQGASHLFVIDNGCTDATIKLLESHPRANDISISLLPRPHRQAEHYREVFKAARIRDRFKWLLIADADEFWFDRAGSGLPDALKMLDGFDLIYCNWTNYGTSASKSHPQSLRKELLRCMPALGPHEFTKWIVKTSTIRRASAIGIHKVSDCRSTHTVSDNERLQINHYVIQSLHYWTQVKMKRGDVFDPANDTVRSMKMFDDLDAACTNVDCTLAKLVDAS
jgi:Glycosyltransferase family 92